MSRKLSWKWLGSQFGVRKACPRGRTRPCLAALEQLEDRVLLSAASVTPPTDQALSAVNAFLKIEGTFNQSQTDFLKAESDFLKIGSHKLTAATVDYFLKIDGDLLKIGEDLVVSPTGAAVGGIDGTLANLKLPASTADNLQKIMPAVEQQLKLDNQLIGLLEPARANAAAAVVTSAAAVNGYIKLDGIPAIAVNFAQIENGLIGADTADLGPALGLQGSDTSPGEAGGLLQDLAVLGADASANYSGTPSAAAPVVDAFLKIENTLIHKQDDFLKIESAFIKYGGNQLTSAGVDYFLKMDQDLIQVDNDSVGPPATVGQAAVVGNAALGGIDGVLLKLNLPANLLATIQQKIMPAIANDRDSAAALEAQLEQGAGGVVMSAADVFLKLDGIKGESQDDKHKDEIHVSSFSFQKIELELVQLDPTDLGPALGPQGSAAPGLAGGFLQDS
ncbi:MAG: type VI secretion system tube protein Hcp, partial [Pirellulales bacterium]